MQLEGRVVAAPACRSSHDTGKSGTSRAYAVAAPSRRRLQVVVLGHAGGPIHGVWMGPAGKELFGGVLLSHPLARAVPSALEGLASGFGMGPGVSPPLWPP